MKNKIDFETLWGGIFGAIAVIAAVVEMVLAGFSGESVVAMIKDVAGTLVVAMVLFVAIKQLLPKKIKSFNEALNMEMKIVESKYSPLIIKNGRSKYGWDIASKLSAIYDNDTGAYHTFFDFDGFSTLNVSVSKTVFMGRSKELFDILQGKIVSDICRKLQANYKQIKSCENTKDGFKVVFEDTLETSDDAKLFADVIDTIMLMFIIEYKK